MQQYRHCRDKAERAILNFQNESKVYCINCTLSVSKEMKLTVYDEVGNENGSDYIRIPLGHDMVLNQFELSKYIACTAQCALGFMDRHVSFGQHSTPDLFHRMMKSRYGIQEPTIPAPPPDILSIFHEWCEIDINNKTDSKTQIQTSIGNGLSIAEFYTLLASDELLGEVVMEPFFIPPYPDEASALDRKDQGYLCAMYTDGLPDKILQEFDLTLTQHLQANPDSDTESDYATGRVHAHGPLDLDDLQKKSKDKKEKAQKA